MPSTLAAPEAATNLAGLWQEFAAPLRAFLRTRVRNEADAEDLLQTVFLKIQLAVSQLHDAARLQGWIYRIARNVVADHFRRGPRETPSEDLPELVAELDGEELVDLRPAIRRMIGMLPADQREAIVLTEFQGMSQMELAQHLGISASGAKSRVQRARQRLRKLLDECCHFKFDGRGRVIEAIPHPPRCAC